MPLERHVRAGPLPACERPQPALQHCERIVFRRWRVARWQHSQARFSRNRSRHPRDTGARARSGVTRGRCRHHRPRGAVQRFDNQADKLQVSTAPDANGIVRRIEVRSEDPEGASDWIVFALANPSDEQIDRLLVVPHYRLVGSGLIWPDLGWERVRAVTPSEGFAPQRVASSEADIFRITLDPGAIVTYVAELSDPKVPEIHLWRPGAYEGMVNSYTLYRGVVLGIAGLLALFLSVLFVVKGTAMFPATAALAWAVFAYISIDFGFWSRVFQGASGHMATWRAGTEVVLAGALLVFLYTYLHLHRWNVRYSHVAVLWLLVPGGARRRHGRRPERRGRRRAHVARADRGRRPRRRSSGSRSSGFDRAIMLIPTWIILLFWVFAAWLAVTGRIDHSVVQPALAGGLVLIVMLIAFTIMQHAFAGGALAQGLISDAEQKALALVGAGHSIWDWDTARDRIETGREIERVARLQARRRSMGLPATGSASSIRTSAISSAPCSMRWSISGAGASTSISACARRTDTSSGSRFAPARSSAPTAR